MTPSYGYEDRDGVKQGKFTVTSNRGTDYDRANIPDGVDDPVAFERKFGQGSSYIAAISADLVDHGKIVEIEQIDFDKLPKRYLYRFVKRLFDIVSSACALVVLAIPMVIIAVAIKLDSEGPVFYRQERLGLNGAPFKLIKFRSMRTDAEANGAQWAQEDDPRITKVGHFIRNTRLDEVPQFLQVITGELSLIGPRPEREIFYNEFEKYIPGFRQRLHVRPGISGLAQVVGGYDFLPEEKIVYDLEYIKNRSISLDLKLMFQTIAVVFKREGAH